MSTPDRAVSVASVASVASPVPPGAVVVLPVTGIPEVRAGDDVGALLEAALRAGPGLAAGDVLVVTSKVVSKAAGLVAPAATKAATVLQQSRRVVAERMTPAGLTRIVQARSGPVLAAAGVDASNTGGADLLLLPEDPDAAARTLRRAVAEAWAAAGHPAPTFGLVLSDTAGRPWRVGQADFALGVAGLGGLDDLRGRPDADGRPLAVTMRAVADEVAAAADLVKGKDDRIPAAVVRGLSAYVGPDDGPGAAELLRAGDADWFALGHVEAVRSALGVAPGTPEAVEVGVPATGAPEDPAVRIARACAVAALPAAWTRVPEAHPQRKRVTRHLDPGAVRLHVVQVGVRVVAPDELTLGIAVGRLIAALAAEGIPAALAQAERTDALVAFL